MIYNLKTNIPNISNEEREHIIRELIGKRMARDLAFFVMTQPYATMDDLFAFGGMIELEFYREVFKEMALFFINNVEDNVMKQDAYGFTVGKLDFHVYVRNIEGKVYTKDEVVRYGRCIVQSEFIETVAKYLTEMRLDDACNLFLTEIFANTSIPGEYIVSDLLNDMRFEWQFRTIKYCIDNDMLSIRSFVEMFHLLKRNHDDDFLNDMLYNIILDRNNILVLFKIIYDKFSVWNNNGKLELLYMSDSNKDYYDSIMYIKRFLLDILKTDIERDFFFNFLEVGRNNFISCGDKKRTMIYNKLFNWYSDNLDNSTFSENFLNKKYVDLGEDFPLSLDESLIMVSDVNTIHYLLQFEHLDMYESFIRLINISRFEFFKYRRKKGIESMVSNSYQISNDNEIISMAMSTEVIAFILYL